MMKSVAIIGAGASALYATLACNDLGFKPLLYSTDEGLRIQQGAYWLKWLPVNLRTKFTLHRITLDKIGTREEYVEKQWPIHPESYTSSFPKERTVEFGFNPYEVLSELFNGERFVYQQLIHPLSSADLKIVGQSFDYVFHAFPTEAASKNNKGVMVKIPVVSSKTCTESNMTIYNGTKDDCIRTSFLFGNKFVEYPFYYDTTKLPDTPSFIWDIRPTETTPNMYPIAPNIIPMGRFGRLDRSLLSHDSYDLVRNILENY